MGLPTAERDWLRETFADAFSRALRQHDASAPAPGVAIVDFMMYVKCVAPTVHTKDQCLKYFSDKIRRILLAPTSTIKTIVIMVDGKKMPVKKLVTDPNRYRNNNTYGNDAKVWPRRGCDLIPTEWMRFAGNSKLMRRWLYPELFNVFMNFQLAPGQTLILSGFPGRARYVSAESGAPVSFEQHMDGAGRVLQVQQWADSELPITKAMERADPDLYHRVYMVQHFLPCVAYPEGRVVHSEWVDARNDISEADVRMFYFDHWFRNEHIIFHLNDGDVFSIGLLYAHERLVHNRTQDGKYVFRNWHTICMPYKKKDKPKKGSVPAGTEDSAPDGAEDEDQWDEIQGFKPNQLRKEEYVDFNHLYVLVQQYEPFLRAHIDNHVATLVFLLIMAGSDFVPKFLHGMGSQNVIWRVFFDNAPALTHLVQLQQHLQPDPRSKRTIVLDEDAFIRFIYWCFLHKYGTKLSGGDHKVRSLTFSQLKRHTQEKADPRFHMPSQNEIRLRARAVLWNLEYWKNGPAGHVPNCFELWYGAPYYPYWRNPAKGNKACRVDVVASRPKPIDAVFAQHMCNPPPTIDDDARVRARSRQAGQTPAVVSQRIQLVLDTFEKNVSSI